MADIMLKQWDSPELGSLTWDVEGHFWNGQTRMDGRDVSVTVTLRRTRKNPTGEEQLAVLEPAGRLLTRLKIAEPSLRQKGAEQIAKEAGGPDFDVDRFVNTMILESIALHGAGELHYCDDGFFPDQLITIYFEEDLSVSETTVYLAKRRG